MGENMEKPDFISRGEIARLIPVTADTSREQRALSVLLAAFRSVHEFRELMLNSVGLRVGKRAKLQAWTEITFPSDPKLPRSDRPDGLIVVDTGRKQWTALVEAKIGNAKIDEEQIKRYLQIAKSNKIDAIITISNEFTALPDHSPIKIPKNQLRSTNIFHWSWMFAVTQATLLLQQSAISDPDQVFILEEVLRNLNHESSGISRFDQMNKEWKDVVNKIKSNGTLNKNSEEVENTVSSWHQEQRDLCLVMSRMIAEPVEIKMPRSHSSDPAERLKSDCEKFARDHLLATCLSVPNAATDIDVVADIRRRTITCSMRLNAPQDKKSTKAKVNWLTKQLSKAKTDNILIKAIRPGRAETTQTSLEEAIKNPDILESKNSNSVATAFEVCYEIDLAGNFSGSRKFIQELELAVPEFYLQVGQKLRAWVAPPPKIKNKDPVTMDKEKEVQEAVYSNPEKPPIESGFFIPAKFYPPE